MASIYLVNLNQHPLRVFSSKRACLSYLKRSWPKCPTNLSVLKMRDGDWVENPRDVTARMYGLTAVEEETP